VRSICAGQHIASDQHVDYQWIIRMVHFNPDRTARAWKPAHRAW
jgi:hypothetical protein